MTSKAMRAAFACAVILAVSLAGIAGTASAQQTIVGERYIPGIWIDPDGCEHWVMDDGAEGYMSPHLNRQGHPVCHRGQVCGVMPSDQFFATDRHEIHPHARQNLVSFFLQGTSIFDNFAGA